MSNEFLDVLRESPDPAFTHALRERLQSPPTGAREDRSIRWRLPAPAWIAACSVALLLTLAFPSVRAVMRDMLNFFDEPSLVGIEVSPDRTAPLRRDLAGRNPALLLFAEEVLEAPGPVLVYPSVEAALASSDLILPEATLDLALDRVEVRGSGSERWTAVPDRLQDLIDRLDLQEAKIPRRIAEGSFDLQRPARTSLVYTGPDGASVRHDLSALPEVNLTRGFDLALHAEIGLRVLGLGDREAHRLARTIDWPRLLVVDLPPGSDSYREVTIRSRQALLISSDKPGHEVAVVWTESDRVHSLAGALSESMLLKMAEETH